MPEYFLATNVGLALFAFNTVTGFSRLVFARDLQVKRSSVIDKQNLIYPNNIYIRLESKGVERFGCAMQPFSVHRSAQVLPASNVITVFGKKIGFE